MLPAQAIYFSPESKAVTRRNLSKRKGSGGGEEASEMDGAQGGRMQAPSEHIFGGAEAQGGETPTSGAGVSFGWGYSRLCRQMRDLKTRCVRHREHYEVYGLCVVWDCFPPTPRMHAVFLCCVGTALAQQGLSARKMW